MPNILVVDDEENIVHLIKHNLEKENYHVVTAHDGPSGFTMAIKNTPDVIILDVMLPGKDGLETCRLLKADKKTSGIPIIFLSARSEEIDRILGLEMGADDYVTKTFSPRELVSRVKACLRRKEYVTGRIETARKEIRIGDILIRPEMYEVEVNGEILNLPPKEFELLEVLASNAGRILTRDLLLEKIWGYSDLKETRTVDVHIRYLRQKIEKDPSNPEYIETVRGYGYRLIEKN